MPPPIWKEVESEVHIPGRALMLLAGMLFAGVGCGSFFVRPQRGDFPVWIPLVFGGAFLGFGLVMLGWCLKRLLCPTRIRHATADVLPDVPTDPVPREFSVVHGKLTHELVEVGNGAWQFRPAERAWRHNRNFMLGFGVPFSIVFAAITTWSFHEKHDWVIAAMLGIGATLLCGGTAFGLIFMIVRAGYRRLARLDIPSDQGDLELDMPQEPDAEQADMAKGVQWIFVGDTKRQRLTIPREQVAVVQLCPWNFRVGNSSTWAVQGLLVLSPTSDGRHLRVPLLLTSDFAGAARLLQRLAATLEVPFRFHADAAGWWVEDQRAKTRPPLRCGGTQS